MTPSSRSFDEGRSPGDYIHAVQRELTGDGSQVTICGFVIPLDWPPQKGLVNCPVCRRILVQQDGRTGGAAVKENFTDWKPKPQINRALLVAYVTVIEEYEAQGYRLTLRQVYYQLVARDLIPNQQVWYKRLGEAVSNGRLGGYIDWESIVDHARTPVNPPDWSSPEAVLEAAAAGYRLDRWEGQDHHVEVWSEKDALSSVIEPVCGRFHVRFLANRGYSSSTAMYDAVQRCMEAKDRGRQPVVIYLGGHDPSGVDMSRDAGDQLDLLTRQYYDQVDEYHPPPNPAKLTDSRSPTYVAMYGLESWELDALDLAALDGMVSGAIEGFLDQDIYDEMLEREESDKAGSWPRPGPCAPKMDWKGSHVFQRSDQQAPAQQDWRALHRITKTNHARFPMIQHFDDPLAPAPIRDIPHILNYAWTTGEFPNASMQMTYAAISRFSDEDGDAQPLQKQILELVPDSASTVKRNIKSMIGLGFLDVSEERWAFDGRRNAYHLTARSRMFQVMPRDPERKPSSVLDAAFNKLDEIRERVADLERENARLRETMQALSAGQDVEMPALGGQIDSGQIDPTKKEEEELSGQFNNHTKESSSFLPGVPGQPESAGSELGVNMTSNTQPELQVEIIESIEAPWLTEMKIWVREHWSRLRHSSTNRDGFRATLPRVIAILADKGEENYRDSRTHWDAVWAEQEEAMAQQREDPSRAAASPQVPPPPEPPAVENVDPEAVSLYDRALELARDELPAEIVERHMAGCAGIAFRDDGGDRTLIIATGAATIYLQRRMYADIHRLVTRAAEQLCVNCGDVEFSWGRVQPAVGT